VVIYPRIVLIKPVGDEMTQDNKVETKKSESDKIWEEIRRMPISLFALPSQTVEDHVERVPVPGKELLVKLTSSAVVAALEEAIGKKYEIEQAEGYTIIRRAAVPLVEEEGPKQYVRNRRR